MHYYQMIDHGNMGVGFILTFIGLTFITLLIILIIKMPTSNTQTNIKNQSTENKPINIIKERYAKGEISKEEFTQLKDDLEN